jgi:mannose-6-phosphate isomerase-like protein (cupin superfamily)
MRAVYKVGTLAILSAVLVGSSAMGATASHEETFVSAAELASKVQSASRVVAYQIPGITGRQVLMIRRDETGEVEVHTKLDDTIIVESGTARFRVGGGITGNHEIGPAEWRGGTLTGWREYTLSAGDLLLIPAGVPHQAVVTSGTFSYLTIKTPGEAARVASSIGTWSNVGAMRFQ